MSDQPLRFNTEDKLRTIHHFVPQSYLKRFARPDKPFQIYAYEIDRKPYSPSIEGIAGQKDFYTYKDTETNKETAELENVFADIDERGANMLKILDELPDGYIELPENQKGDLYYYVAHLHTRNVQQRKLLADAYGKMSLVQAQAVASDKDTFHQDARNSMGDKYEFDAVEQARHSVETGETKIDFDPMSDHFIGATLENAQHLYFILMKLKRAVLLTVKSGEKSFVTSDNPVTHYLENEDPRRSMGVGYVDAIFQLPISPTRCLLLIDDDYVIDEFDCNSDHVDHMNYYTYRFADRWVFSHENLPAISEMFNKYKAKESTMKVTTFYGEQESTE